MDYIDFGNVQRIPKADVQAFLDVYAMLQWEIPKNSVNGLQWQDHLGRIRDRFTVTPHFHYLSNRGPFCAACYCSLPGPNGEWG